MSEKEPLRLVENNVRCTVLRGGTTASNPRGARHVSNATVAVTTWMSLDDLTFVHAHGCTYAIMALIPTHEPMSPLGQRSLNILLSRTKQMYAEDLDDEELVNLFKQAYEHASKSSTFQTRGRYPLFRGS